MNPYRAAALLIAGMAIATSAYADDAKYVPTSKNIAGTKAFSQSYTLELTSPARLNGAGDDLIDGAGVPVALKVTAVSWPLGGSKAAAEALVTLSAPSLLFTDLNQAQTVDITFTATGSTLAGDYAYTIQGDPPTGLGWGVGSHALSVEVAEPAAVDTTPPNVSITAPADGTSFAFCAAGIAVNVGVDASDAESVVTLVTATIDGTDVPLTYAAGQNVTATGTYLAASVGAYEVNASAISAGGTGSASPVHFTVKYDTMWLPPLSLGKTSKGGSTIPIKFTARDCNGVFVHDERVAVRVREGAADVFAAAFGEGADAVRIEDEDGHYLTNFPTAAGPHTYTVEVLFNSVVHQSLTFAVR